jgi:uncharacterized protein YunC (DUF1805 family)
METKVRSYEDMLETRVAKVSDKAATLRIEVGMKGREALKIMGGI